MKLRHWVFAGCMGGTLAAFCSAAEVVSMDRAHIDAQKIELQNARDAIMQAYETSSRHCWQRFMVNDCLHAARAQRRRDLEPIEKQEQSLRAAQRALTAMEREERLRSKQPLPEESHDVTR